MDSAHREEAAAQQAEVGRRTAVIVVAEVDIRRIHRRRRCWAVAGVLHDRGTNKHEGRRLRFDQGHQPVEILDQTWSHENLLLHRSRN